MVVRELHGDAGGGFVVGETQCVGFTWPWFGMCTRIATNDDRLAEMWGGRNGIGELL